MELAALIQRIQAGDQEAFAILFDQYKHLVYRTAVLLLGDCQDADEALQEIFLKVYRSLDSYQPEKGAFTTWLYRITTNHCLNQRRKPRLEKVPLDMAEWDDHQGEFSHSEHLDEDQALQMAINHLSDKLRALIVLRFYGGLSYVEIAESLDVPIGTVKSRLALAIKNLRRDLETDDLAEFVQRDEAIS